MTNFKDTGFHPADADWTRGRALALADAESVARRQVSMARAVTLIDGVPQSEVEWEKL